MKRILLGCAFAVAFAFSTGDNVAEAQGIRFSFGSDRHGHYDRGYNYYGQGYRGYYRSPYRSNWGRSHSRWHDTSHYDYHPGSFQRHYNHYHYVPGHYDYHRSGHWDRH